MPRRTPTATELALPLPPALVRADDAPKVQDKAVARRQEQARERRIVVPDVVVFAAERIVETCAASAFRAVIDADMGGDLRTTPAGLKGGHALLPSGGETAGAFLVGDAADSAADNSAHCELHQLGCGRAVQVRQLASPSRRKP